MLREITKQVGRRFRPGDVHDYPRSVWAQIETDARKLSKDFKDLDAFSKPIAINPALQSPLKGRLHEHKRLGT